MKALVTGATGFLGIPLVRALADEGHDLVLLTRRPAAAPALVGVPGAEYVFWDAEQGPPPAAALRGVDAVIALQGEGVADARWTPERKRRLRDSRVLGTRHLVEALRAKPPAVFLGASGISAQGTGFLAELTHRWEAEMDPLAALGTRLVKLRFGAVLGAGGGALAHLVPIFRAGLGGRVGDGRQRFSWIHQDDATALIRFALAHQTLAGPVDVVAPHPVTNAAFTRSLGRALRRPTWFPVPAGALRLLLGERASLVLDGLEVRPAAALAAGFTFRFPELDGALEDLCGRARGRKMTGKWSRGKTGESGIGTRGGA